MSHCSKDSKQQTDYSSVTSSSLVAQMVKHLPTMWETWVRSLGWEDLLEKEMTTHSSIPAWRQGQRSLVGYSPWGCKESDMTEQLNNKRQADTEFW